jgi:hypothetical protein
MKEGTVEDRGDRRSESGGQVEKEVRENQRKGRMEAEEVDRGADMKTYDEDGKITKGTKVKEDEKMKNWREETQ